MTSRALRWLGCLLILSPLLAAAEEAKAFVDKEYQFQLQAPSADWRVLSGQDMQAVTPDALAGLNGPRGLWMAVIAEEAGGAKLETFAKLILAAMPLENKQVARNEGITFQGRPAIQFDVSGRISEIEVRYVNTIYEKDGFVFQVIVWAPTSLARDAYYQPALDAYRVLPGKVVGRGLDTDVPDSEGVGWRVRNGQFESAALGLAVRPTGGWRVAIGDELDTMNPDAEVGLVHGRPDVYAALLIEPAAGVDQKAFIETLLDPARMEGELTPIEYSLPLKVGEQRVATRGFRLQATQDIEFLKGAFFHGNLCVQLVLWYAEANRKVAAPLLQQACDAIRMLSQAEIGTLTEELRLGPDPENKVGPTYALRRGVYRDFAHDLTWTKPANEFWRMLAGDEARVVNDAARLYVEHPSLGVMGILIPEEGGDFDAETYHRVVVERLFAAPPKGKPRKLKVDGGIMLVTEADESEGALEMRYRSATTLRNGRAYQVLLYGLANNMKAASKQLDRLLKGLRFPRGLEPRENRLGRYRDYRMGYQLRAPKGWTRTDATPEAVRGIGSFQMWRKGTDACFVVSVCSRRPGQDAKWFRTMMSKLMERMVAHGVDDQPETRAATIAGVEGEVASWSLAEGRNTVWFFSRDKTYFAVARIGDKGVSAEAIQAFQATFKLLD